MWVSKFLGRVPSFAGPNLLYTVGSYFLAQLNRISGANEIVLEFLDALWTLLFMDKKPRLWVVSTVAEWTTAAT